MPLLWSSHNTAKIFNGKALFHNINLSISDRERIGLIGPNGAGKSTLLKIIAGREQPDEGTCSSQKGLKISYLDQSPHFTGTATVLGVLEKRLAEDGVQGFDGLGEAKVLLGRFGFDHPEALVNSLSGGWTKRLAIAESLVVKPDLLLLDEPTNHLDVEGILLLEEIIKTLEMSVVVISHDRYFLQNTATRMVEVNRLFAQGILDVKGNYTDFLIQKDEYLSSAAQQEASLANKVRREIAWLRSGVKARTTKSQARINQAQDLIKDLGERKERAQTGETQIVFSSSGRKTKQLISASKISKTFGPKKLFANLSFVLCNGQRLGLIGANGCGKSTLLNMLAKKITPDTGEVTYAENLRVVYFDQLRQQLDPNLTIKKVLAPFGDSVNINGTLIHIASYAARYQFRPQQLDTPIHKLSGGEQARLLLARLILEPADVLLLDEPTNDLDIDSLESLEESLIDFPGAVVLISHDRFLLDRVSTHMLGFDGDGRAHLYADFAQWQEHQKSKNNSPTPKSSTKEKDRENPPPRAQEKQKRLSYMEQREWDSIEPQIIEAEERAEACREAMENPEISTSPQKLLEASQALAQTEQEIEQLYKRWAELEGKIK